MEENNVIEVAEISRENFDGVIDSLMTDRDELRKQLEEKDKQNKKLIQENMNLKKPKEARFWVKVYKDSDLSFLSFRDKGILFSLCQLIGKNKGGYLEDRNTGGIIETWSQLGRNIGIKDDAHTRNACKKLEENGILVVEHLSDSFVMDNEMNSFNEHHFRRDKRRAAVMVDKRHFRIDKKYCSIGRDKGNA